jgi:hypothetical protein
MLENPDRIGTLCAFRFFFAAGVMKSYLPEQMVAKHLGKGNVLSVLKASLFGIPLPLVAAELVLKGLSPGAPLYLHSRLSAKNHYPSLSYCTFLN